MFPPVLMEQLFVTQEKSLNILTEQSWKEEETDRRCRCFKNWVIDDAKGWPRGDTRSGLCAEGNDPGEERHW